MSRGIIKNSSSYQRLELPIVEDVSAAVADAKQNKSSGLMTAEQLQRIQEQAYKEAHDAGFAKGYKEGIQSGKHEITQQSQLLTKLLRSLSKPYESLDDTVEEELVNLCVTIARQLVRRELRTDPGQVIAVVREALKELPVASRQVRVYLHPEDVVLVQDAFSQNNAEREWVLVDDPALNRGDCRILSENSVIDASLERRMAAIVSQMLGGERSQDEPAPQSTSQDGE